MLMVVGDDCEVDVNECELKTAECYNDAACVNEPGTYSCNCSLGYVGEHCETANCSLGQCANGGTCRVDASRRWLCDCPKFYSGTSSVIAVLLLVYVCNRLRVSCNRILSVTSNRLSLVQYVVHCVSKKLAPLRQVGINSSK